MLHDRMVMVRVTKTREDPAREGGFMSTGSQLRD
jgi:hypothetical protein